MESKDTTLTPLKLIKAIGVFDLDPCAFEGHNTAKKFICLPNDGLLEKWKGLIWLNPPYSNPEPWLKRMSKHNNGVALVLVSTETNWFFEYIWESATSIFFLKGRPKFLRADMSEIQLMRATCLVGYGRKASWLLKNSSLIGKYIEIK